ncbi:MAG: hypothetical protein AAFX01_02280 [Cyanobacteria bacterium J06638_28]
MTKAKKIRLGLLMGAGFLLLAYIGYMVFIVSTLITGWSEQMDTGIAYMESLTEHDVPYWIEISQDYLAQPCLAASTGCPILIEDEIPSDLRDIGIMSVRVHQDEVYYVWLGGMDHTYLLVSQEPDQSFSLIAHHNNEIPSKVLWSQIPAPKAEGN